MNFWRFHDDVDIKFVGNWIEHTKQLKEERDSRIAMWEEVENKAKEFPMLAGSGLLSEHYETELTVIGIGYFGVVFRASRGGQTYAIKMLTQNYSPSAILEVSLLLYMFTTLQKGQCARDLICYSSHFRARLGEKFYNELTKYAETQQLGELSVTIGGAREKYVKNEPVRFIETRLENGPNMEVLINGNRVGVKQSAGPSLSFQQNLAILISLVGAVRFLHRNFIYHRDIFPKNIIVVNYSPGTNIIPYAVLIDFGVACMLDQCWPPTQYPFQQDAQDMLLDLTEQSNDVKCCLDVIYDWLDGSDHAIFRRKPRLIPAPSKEQSMYAPLWDIVERYWEQTHRDAKPTLADIPPITADDLYDEFNALIFPFG